MNISPRDILDKEFSRKMRGYDPGEVDEFLDEIIKQFESLIEENENVVAKNAELKSEVSRLRARDVKQEGQDERLMAVVLGAQRSANLYLERAESQASKIMEMANANARAIMETAQYRMEAVQQEIAKYERAISDYKRQFRRLVEQQAAYMDAHTISTEEVDATRREVDGAVARIQKQIRDLDNDQSQENARVRDYAEDAKDDTGFEFREQNSADLQDIVNDILDD